MCVSSAQMATALNGQRLVNRAIRRDKSMFRYKVTGLGLTVSLGHSD